MHNLLQLKKQFFYKNNNNKGGGVTLPKNTFVMTEHISQLKNNLITILKYWENDTRIDGALVSVHYRRIIPKSRRIRRLLYETGKSPDTSVRGAKFEWDEDGTNQRHVFTHFIGLKAIKKSIELLKLIENYINENYGPKFTSEDLTEFRKKILPKNVGFSRTAFVEAICDCFYVERFDIDRPSFKISDTMIITIYKTKVDTKKLLNSLGISISEDRIIEGTTLRLLPGEVARLQAKAPYLIAMSITDFSKIPVETIGDEFDDYQQGLIPHPSNEPVVGVIDTQFNKDVYFHEWVESHNMLSTDIEIHGEDCKHGTSVCSIIVDGPKGNPRLDDGCGRFRVKHFGVATHEGFSAFSVLKMIRQIVSENSDIKVWNLSLGSKLEINPSFISPVAAELDALQTEYDVVFVVAGTNKPDVSNPEEMKIGSPADSINSIVVNSVDFGNKPASYTRRGPVLSFFHKPDVSYYGGDGVLANDQILACCDVNGASYVVGTSYAAPWITRKMAYMIEVLGLSREVAKALLIDSAAGWNRESSVSNKIGYGIVPVNIRDVVNTKNDDEIKFFISGQTRAYETYNYELPVPIVKGHHPFLARATLVYYPLCNRLQGVDYTTTEMDIHFGRVKEKEGKNGKYITIDDIQSNKQDEPGTQSIYESVARNLYRKWDNVKHAAEKVTGRNRSKKAFSADGMWGIKINTKERIAKNQEEGLNFGLVITLKEIKGVDRYDDFIQMCQLRGWLVNSIDIENRVGIYIHGEENITLE